MPATDSTRILSSLWSSARGRVLVTTSLMGAFLSRSMAGPEKIPVAAAVTWAAPLSISTSAPWTMVPAVSIMSSISTHWRPSTSPTTSRTSTWRASVRLRRSCGGRPGGRRAGRPSSRLSGPARRRGRPRPGRGPQLARMRAPRGTGMAVRWSTGLSKNPLDLPGVQVHGDQPVGPGHVQHVGDQLGRDGFPNSRPFLS